MFKSFNMSGLRSQRPSGGVAWRPYAPYRPYQQRAIKPCPSPVTSLQVSGGRIKRQFCPTRLEDYRTLLCTQVEEGENCNIPRSASGRSFGLSPLQRTTSSTKQTGDLDIPRLRIPCLFSATSEFDPRQPDAAKQMRVSARLVRDPVPPSSC